MLYKLIQRGLPGWFPFNSVAVMQPMYTKKANEKIARELGTIAQFSLDDPKPPAKPVVLVTNAAVRSVLTDPKGFTPPWLHAFDTMFAGKKDLSWFMLSGDEPANYTNRTNMDKVFAKLPNLLGAVRDLVQTAGSKFIEKEGFALRDGLMQLDLVRDLAIPLCAQFLGDLFYFDLRSDENPNGALVAAELYRHLLDIRIWGVNNNDPAQAWNRRRRAQEAVQAIIDSTRPLIDKVILSRGFGLGIASALSAATSSLKKGSLRSCGQKLVEELLAQGNTAERVVDTMWVTAFGGIGVIVTTVSLGSISPKTSG
jgi:hypothetical protein